MNPQPGLWPGSTRRTQRSAATHSAYIETIASTGLADAFTISWMASIVSAADTKQFNIVYAQYLN